MIAVKLMGGLGNQMFQYSIGRSISLSCGVPLKLDRSFLERKDLGESFTYRNYELDLFKIDPDLVLSNNKSWTFLSEPHHHLFSENIIRECSERIRNGQNVYLEGYWQTPKYFEKIEDIIRKDFTFKNRVEDSREQKIQEMVRMIKESNSVMINVRRTDYLNNPFHIVLDELYVKKAIEMIEERVDDPRYFVFSDDIEWCRNNLQQRDFIFVDKSYAGDRYSYYIQLMSLCKSFVIANSTFSWWSAWLNSEENKIVISPKKWFSPPDIDSTDLIPKNWTLIRN